MKWRTKKGKEKKKNEEASIATSLNISSKKTDCGKEEKCKNIREKMS